MPDSGAGSRDRSTRGKITAAGYRADGFGPGKFGFGWFRACGGHLGEVERRVRLSHGVFVFCTRSSTVALMSTERTEVEARREYVAAMGAELGGVFFELRNQCIMLH